MSIKSETGLFSLRTVRGPQECAGDPTYNNACAGNNTCGCLGTDHEVDPPCACAVGCGSSCGCACACV